MNLVRLTEQAMDEAIDQERAILFPARDKDSGVIRRCHERLSQEQDGTGILTLPLVDDGEILGGAAPGKCERQAALAARH
ncbi:hypothetical protein QW131_31935 [Roseibium salinum]|nr:hypothetical protein [Roseibium salinum]